MAMFQILSNRLLICLLCAVHLGGFAYQFITKEAPCALCLLQRLGMMSTALALLFNLRLGIRVEHYGLAILSSFVGSASALRQLCLHICPQFPPLGKPVFGLSVYVWSYLTFLCIIFACALLLILLGYTKDREALPPSWSPLDRSLFAVVLLIGIANLFYTIFKITQ